MSTPAPRSRPGEPVSPTARGWLALAAALWPWLCAAASGVMLALCFPNWNQTWLCWLALGPVLCAIWFRPAPARRRWLQDALLGYAAGLVFFTITFWWLNSLAPLFHSQWLAGIPPLLACYLSLYFAFWGGVVGSLPRGDTRFLSSGRNLVIGLVGASAWVAQEWPRGYVLGGFGWNGLGVALHRNLALIQIADISGVFGLSFLVAFVNIIAVITIRRFVAEVGVTRVRPHWDFSVMMAAIVAVFSYGVHAIQHPAETVGGSFSPLRIASVQADIPETDKFDPAQEQKIVDRYTALTQAAIAWKPQLLLWPEAATPTDLFDPDTFAYVKNLASQTDANFLTGSLLSTAGEGEYNIAALLTHGGRDIQIYRKVHLVPFGEYVPLRDSFPLFAKIAASFVPGDLQAGHNYTVFRTDSPPLHLAPLICFEDTLGDLTRRFVAGGADLLVNITNDGWFGHTPGCEQHLAHAIFRAIENRRPLVRAANTGVTCVVDPLGRVTHALRDAQGTPFLEGVLFATVDVPQGAPLTFYTRYGDWIVVFSAAVTFLYLGLRYLRRPE